MTIVSIVIPTYNRVDSLKKCINALLAQTLPRDYFEVIVIDDGSVDDTAEFLEFFRRGGELKVKVYHQQNAGPAIARNLGICHANGELIVFTDDDCIPASNWLEMLIGAFSRDERCAGVGGAIIRQRDRLISRYIDDIGVMHHPVHDGQAEYLVTANALYRKSCLHEVGGFDKRILWPGGEDPDLSFRLRDHGYYFLTCPAAIIRHEHRDTLKGLIGMFWNHGRGKSALVQFKRVKNENIWLTLIKRYIDSPIKYYNRLDLPIHERLIFCAFRWIQYTAFFMGYLSCPNFENQSITKIQSNKN